MFLQMVLFHSFLWLHNIPEQLLFIGHIYCIVHFYIRLCLSLILIFGTLNMLNNLWLYMFKSFSQFSVYTFTFIVLLTWRKNY